MPKKPARPTHAKPAHQSASTPLEQRVEDLLARMTLEEKAAQLTSCFKGTLLRHDEAGGEAFDPQRTRKLFPEGLGRISVMPHGGDTRRVIALANEIQAHFRHETRLGIPVLLDTEALHGSLSNGSTAFPQAIGLAAMWDEALLREIATAIGTEVRAVGASQVLSPVLDIARDCRCGRTEETYGEDSYLASRCAVAFVGGIQSQRVAATPKHFAGNFAGDGGRDSNPIHFSERLMREVYLAPYEAAVREAGALGIMCAYHSLDGVPCAVNRWLLTDVLRGEWGFHGIVVSDWAAVSGLHETHRVARDYDEAAVAALGAGMDVELPATFAYRRVAELVRAGKLPLAVLDETIRRVLRVKFWAGLFDRPFADPDAAVATINQPAHRALALQAARESIVLLKNDGLLPLLKTAGSIAVIGPSAAQGRLGGYSTPGVEIVSPLAGIKAAVSARTTVRFEAGCEIEGTDTSGIAGAVEAARQAGVVVVCVGSSHTSEGEGRDRAFLDLPGVQDALVRQVLEANPNVIVVLISGRPVTMRNWVDRARAIVAAWYPGQAGGTALAEVLFGDISPSGRLPISFPRTVGQLPLYYNTKPSGRGYEYTDLPGLQAQFPFGHGLSYSTFDYSDLKIRKTGAGRRLRLDVSANIRNAGSRVADEVVQLYIRRDYGPRSQPLRELKGFRRVTIEPGGRAAVRFSLGWKELACLGEDLKPELHPGNLQIMLGSSCEDIRLRGETEPDGSESVEARVYDASQLFPAVPDIADAPPPPADTVYHEAVRFAHEGGVMCLQGEHHGRHGLLYLRTRVSFTRRGPGRVAFGADAPVRIWVNGAPVACEPYATNPFLRNQYHAAADWQKGENEIIFAISTNFGGMWGVTVRADLAGPGRRKTRQAQPGKTKRRSDGD